MAPATTARILRATLRGSTPFDNLDALLAKYYDVLAHAKLQRRHGPDTAEADMLLTALTGSATVQNPAMGPRVQEPGDHHLWNLLASHIDLCVVTGDALLLHADNPPAPVMSPADSRAGEPQI